MIFESQNGTRIENVTLDELIDHTKKINGSSNSYAYLEKQEGSYIQVGGGPVEFTVELRNYMDDGSFVHSKASKSQKLDAEIKQILIGGAAVTVQSSQILHIHDVETLFKAYLSETELPPSIFWHDITDRFV